QLDNFNAVRKKQDDPVAGTSAALPQPVRHALNSQLKFTIGEPLVSADQRDLVGTAHRLCAKNVFQAHVRPSDELEGWILDFVRQTIPGQLDALSDRYSLRIHIQNVAKNAHALVQQDRCNRKRQPAFETRPRYADDRARINCAVAGDLTPFEIPAAGVDADRTRIVLE